MATIKSFTDLQQSKVLAEILPLESADMFYSAGNETQPTFRLHSYGHIISDKDVCAWSLAALLDVFPILDNRSPVIPKTFDGKYRVVYHSTAYEKAILTSDYDNPIDACYEMIIRLNELKML